MIPTYLMYAAGAWSGLAGICIGLWLGKKLGK